MAEVVGSASLLSSPSTSIFCDLSCWMTLAAVLQC
jgi:hypothetical protein